MRIVHAMSGLGNDIESEAVERVLRSLSNKYDFEVIAPEGNSLLGRLSGTRVKLTPMNLSLSPCISLYDVMAYRRYFKRCAPYMLHSHNAPSARLGAMLSGVRRLVSPITDLAGLGSLGRGLYNATTTITISPSASLTKRLISFGVSEDRIVNLPYGIDREPTTGAGVTSEKIVLSVVTDRAECPVLLSGVARALREYAFSVVVIAERELWPTIFRFAALMGIHTHTRVVEPHLSRKYYSICRFFVYPSASEMKIPTPVTTAMSAGVAVIVPSTPICRDMVSDGVCGLVYNSEDGFALSECISRLIADDSLAARLGGAARERWQKHFSTECMVAAYDNLYTTLLCRPTNQHL